MLTSPLPRSACRNRRSGSSSGTTTVRRPSSPRSRPPSEPTDPRLSRSRDPSAVTVALPLALCTSPSLSCNIAARCSLALVISLRMSTIAFRRAVWLASQDAGRSTARPPRLSPPPSRSLPLSLEPGSYTSDEICTPSERAEREAARAREGTAQVEVEERERLYRLGQGTAASEPKWMLLGVGISCR